jgi:hypothetical protein
VGQDGIISKTLMRLLTFAISVMTCSISFGQTKQYQNLLDTALKRNAALFVYSKPITKIQLDKTDMWNYFYFHHDYANKVLDTIMFAQIIENSKSVDTTLWRETELKSFIVVSNREETISKKKAFQKLQLTDKNQIKLYKKKINRFNSTDSYNRNLYYFSRPVFDNSIEYAIVQWDNAHSGLGGGGGIILYHFQGDKWKEVGIIMNWKY